MLKMIFSLLFLVSCSGQKITNKAVAPKSIDWPNYQTEQITLAPGHVKKITYHLDEKWKETELICNEAPMVFHREKTRAIAYISIPYKEEKKSFSCNLIIKHKKQRKEIKLVEVKIKDYNYPTRYLQVAKKHVSLSEENVKRWQKEVEAQNAVYSNGVTSPYFTKPFMKPLQSKITSVYGSKRVFNNQKDSWHSGTDFRASIGTPIPAANRGKVVFVDELFFNGNTVIIDHGAGIFTMYCHLSKFNTKVGELIPQGDIIAYSGNTGRSTAPHLHWGVKVQSNWIDGRVLVLEDQKMTPIEEVKNIGLAKK